MAGLNLVETYYLSLKLILLLFSCCELPEKIKKLMQETLHFKKL